MARKTGPIEKAEAILELLQACCERGSTAFITSPVTGAARSGVFIQASPSGVLVSVESSPGAFPPGTLCVVTYTGRRKRSSVFVARVQDEGEPPGAVFFELPVQIVPTDARTIFRIPMVDNHGLVVEVVRDGATFEVVPVDISLEGIRVRLDEDPVWNVDERIQLRLRRDDEDVTLAGEIVHRDAPTRTYGMCFSDLVPGEAPEAPEALRSIVMGLQRHWVGTRAAQEVRGARGTDRD